MANYNRNACYGINRAIRFIEDRYGTDAIKDRRLLFAYVSDIVTNYREERALFMRMLDSSLLSRLADSRKRPEFDRNIPLAMMDHAGVKEDAAAFIVDCFDDSVSRDLLKDVLYWAELGDKEYIEVLENLFYSFEEYPVDEKIRGKIESLRRVIYESQQSIDAALNLIKEAADNGLVAAQFSMASLCYKKYIDEDDSHYKDDIMIRWLYKAAGTGHLKAMYFLGKLYNRADSISLLYKAAERGDVPSQLFIGSLYRDDFFILRDSYYGRVKIDLDESLKWFEKAAGKSADSAYVASVYLLSGNDEKMKKGAEMLLRSNDNPTAKYYLGLAFFYGLGVEKDASRGVALFSEAAKDDANAEYYLGMAYEYGEGVEKSSIKALFHYSASNTKCQCHISVLERFMHLQKELNDDGNKEDPETAEGQYQIGFSYFYGIDAEKDEALGVEWFRKAAENDYAPALLELGMSYEFGEGVGKNIEMAKQLYDGAAAHGLEEACERHEQMLDVYSDEEWAEAQYDLAQAYFNGDGVEKDIDRGEELLAIAANGGNLKAKFKLGAGILGKFNDVKSVQSGWSWIWDAARHGCHDAQIYIGEKYLFAKTGNDDSGSLPADILLGYYNEVISNGDQAEELVVLSYMLYHGVDELSVVIREIFTKLVDKMPSLINYFRAYVNTIGDDADWASAIDLYMNAAENGFAPAALKLGLAYENGKYVEKNVGEAIWWFLKSADQGCHDAQCIIGVLYCEFITGNKITLYKEDALIWYSKAKSLGIDYGNYITGPYLLLYGNKQDEVRGVNLIRQYKDKMPDVANYLLGYAYMNGIGVDKDIYAGADYLYTAVMNGYAPAQYELGIAYEHDVFIDERNEKNNERFNVFKYNHYERKEAIELIIKSAKKGFLKAQFWLGKIYHEIITDDDDTVLKEEDLLKWYNKLVNQGENYEKHIIGPYLFFYTTIEEEKQIGLKIIECYKDEMPEIYNYTFGALLFNGDMSNETNIVTAAELIGISAEKGYVSARIVLGILHMEGIGVEKDLQKAMSLFYETAALGNHAAQQKIGIMCQEVVEGYKRTDLENDDKMEEALEWYHKAMCRDDYFEKCIAGPYLLIHGNHQEKSEGISSIRKYSGAVPDILNYYLGLAYYRGNTGWKDYKNAADLFYYSAEKNYIPALYALSCCYANGEGVKPNRWCAMVLCREAAESGFPYAIKAMDRYDLEQDGIEYEGWPSGTRRESVLFKDEKARKNPERYGVPQNFRFLYDKKGGLDGACIFVNGREATSGEFQMYMKYREFKNWFMDTTKATHYWPPNVPAKVVQCDEEIKKHADFWEGYGLQFTADGMCIFVNGREIKREQYNRLMKYKWFRKEIQVPEKSFVEKLKEKASVLGIGDWY